MILPTKRPQSVAPADQERIAKRKNFFGMFIGTNRTGKSVTARQYAEKWKIHNPEGFILAFDPQDNFENIADEFIVVGQKNWEQVATNKRNALLVFDDYRLLNMKNTPYNAFIQLMNYRAKWNVDIIMVTHSPSLVLAYFAFYVTDYFIFYTQTQKDTFERKIPNYQVCLDSSELINAYVKMHGRGEYPKFPHIIVNNDSDNIVLQGIDKEKFLQTIKSLEDDKRRRKRK